MGAKCSICGRAISNPASVAAGVGPICGGRSYKSRIMDRHGSLNGGWVDIEVWEKVNHPCYSCTHFRFPAKHCEITFEDGRRRVSFPAKNPYTGKRSASGGRQEVKTFPSQGIGGLCRYLDQLVDGNQIREDAACAGKHYQARKGKKEQPEAGLLRRKNGQYELFKLD